MDSKGRANGLRYLRFAVVTRPKRAAARKASGARRVSPRRLRAFRLRFERGEGQTHRIHQTAGR